MATLLLTLYYYTCCDVVGAAISPLAPCWMCEETGNAKSADTLNWDHPLLGLKYRGSVVRLADNTGHPPPWRI